MDPADGLYTDGSCKKDKDTGVNMLGAAVYDARAKSFQRVQPNGLDATNTITRAELSAIHQALAVYGDHQHILRLYTDSLASLHLTRKILTQPFLLRESKHLDLLTHIRALLLARAKQGRATHFFKVKSHSGVMGNEAADRVAVAVAEGKTHVDRSEDSDGEPYKRLWWLSAAGRDLANLTGAVKRAVGQATAGGFAGVTTYGALWETAMTDLDAAASNAMWTAAGVRFTDALQVFRYRWGHLHNMKLAARYRKLPPEMAACPLCGHEDSGPHILGGCQHTDMTALYISRHNEAVRAIAKALSRGSLSGHYMIMDACAAGALPHYVSATRLPPWLLPGMPDGQRKKLRPDILIVEGLSKRDVEDDDDPSPNRGCTVHIIEVGYCGDLGHAAKRLAKEDQHRELAAALQEAGWKVAYGQDHIITVGVGGTIHNGTIPTLQDLGVTKAAAQACMRSIHTNTVHRAGDIIRVRRMKERLAAPVAPGHPP